MALLTLVAAAALTVLPTPAMALTRPADLTSAALTSSPGFKAYAQTAVWLVVLYIVVTFNVGRLRTSLGAMANTEDIVLKKGAKVMESPAVTRAVRLQLNLLESLPFYFIIGLLTVLIQGSKAATLPMYLYAATRTLSTVFHATGVQPYRTVAWSVSMFTLSYMSITLGMSLLA
eukprot:jgi/Chlat1/355/Chrsp10S01480